MSIFSPVFFKKNFEDLQVMKGLESILKIKRGYGFRMPPKKTPVILVVSGGMDSIMLWFHLLETYGLQVYPIHFIGPNSVLGEQLSVNYFYSYFKKRFPDLVNPAASIPVQFNFSFNQKENKKIVEYNPAILIQNLYVNAKTKNNKIMLINYPIRLASYGLAAYEYGLKLQTKGVLVHTIFTGIVPDDGYTTRESTLTVLRSLNVYLCTLLGDWKWQITAPLEKKSGFFYTKSKTLKMAFHKKIPIEKTWSCGAYYIRQCGLCSACKRRQLAFKEAGVRDKTFYLISHKNRMRLKKIYLKLLSFFQKKTVTIISPITKKKLLASKLILAPTVVYYEEKNCGYIFNKKTGDIVNVNSTGQYIFQKLKKNESVTPSILISQLHKSFPRVNSLKITNDFFIFLKKMLKKGLILSGG